QRGHRVTLCEASGALGGNLRCETNVPFKAAFPKYIETMTRRMELAGVEVRLNTPVTPEFVREFAPDALFVAVGAEAARPPIPGLDGANVVFGTELERREGEIGRRVAVIGGGLVGCESGLYLAQKGHEVTIVELREEVARDANPRHRPALMAELAAHATVRTGLRVTGIVPKGVLCESGTGEKQLIEADTVLCAAGLRPRNEIADALRGTAPIVELIGDCVKPDIIRGATWRAYHAALDL
ncbi:MAG: FAD-dependent oxidoreductase, partial [Oscillospiraceae bacterium]|nr:FAD-dependent oxidoreductase [Oscillospiraceae bacterium]